jgi:hypothetical protein
MPHVYHRDIDPRPGHVLEVPYIRPFRIFAQQQKSIVTSGLTAIPLFRLLRIAELLLLLATLLGLILGCCGMRRGIGKSSLVTASRRRER